MPDANGNWTTADAATIRRILATGVQSASHADKAFTNRSVAELKDILTLIESSTAGANRPKNYAVASFKSGL